MLGIDMNQPIAYKLASLRFFENNEHHISRYCEDDVLLLVYDGILRFSEDDIDYEVGPGQYHIQKRRKLQRGDVASDAPKYLYVHFCSHWTEANTALPFRGEFDYEALKGIMEELDKLSHSGAAYIEQAAKFYALLSALYNKKSPSTPASRIADYIEQEYLNPLTLDMLCRQFNFSKNHIINIFKDAYGATPFEYINHLKIKRTEYLLEVTSDPIESIAYASGFNNYSQFYRLFCRKNGISPAQWRSKKRLHPTRQPE